jgi:hypothetical protein
MNNNLEQQTNQVEEPVAHNAEQEQSLAEVQAEILNNIDSNTDSVLTEGSDLAGGIEDMSQEEKDDLDNIQVEIKSLQEQTKKEIEIPANLEKETPENFKKAASILLRSMESLEDTAEKGYVFSGESLVEKTSRGKEINVDYLSWISDDGFASDMKRRLVLIATDLADGRLVGLRLSDIKKDGFRLDENGEYIDQEKVVGEILTRDRGEGIAPALDSAFLKVISRLANYYQQEYAGNNQLNWVVENANLRRLEERKEDGLSESDLKELEEEQARWQSVYGENGKFGFQKIKDNYYSKIIKPDVKEGESYEMQSVDMVKFKKMEDTLRI